MMTDDDRLVSLVTRIPKGLHRRIKLDALEHDVRLMAYIADALREKLAAATRGTPQTGGRAASNAL